VEDATLSRPLKLARVDLAQSDVVTDAAAIDGGSDAAADAMHDGDVTAAGEDARAGSGAAETAGARRGVCAATVMVPGAGGTAVAGGSRIAAAAALLPPPASTDGTAGATVAVDAVGRRLATIVADTAPVRMSATSSFPLPLPSPVVPATTTTTAAVAAATRASMPAAVSSTQREQPPRSRANRKRQRAASAESEAVVVVTSPTAAGTAAAAGAGAVAAAPPPLPPAHTTGGVSATGTAAPAATSAVGADQLLSVPVSTSRCAAVPIIGTGKNDHPAAVRALTLRSHRGMVDGRKALPGHTEEGKKLLRARMKCFVDLGSSALGTLSSGVTIRRGAVSSRRRRARGLFKKHPDAAAPLAASVAEVVAALEEATSRRRKKPEGHKSRRGFESQEQADAKAALSEASGSWLTMSRVCRVWLSLRRHCGGGLCLRRAPRQHCVACTAGPEHVGGVGDGRDAAPRRMLP
jgi:hypothetical protein